MSAALKKQSAKRLVAAAAGVAAITVLSAGVAQAASYTLSGQIPRFGSETFDANDFFTTSQYNDINFNYTENPYSSVVKPVRCSDFANISGYKSIGANDHGSKVLAASVLDGTCFNINIDSDTSNYWNFKAAIRA